MADCLTDCTMFKLTGILMVLALLAFMFFSLYSELFYRLFTDVKKYPFLLKKKWLLEEKAMIAFQKKL